MHTSLDLIINQASLLGFASYFGTLLGMTALFIALYIWVTPYNEIAMIRSGGAPGTAAAVSLFGTVLGFELPLAVVGVHAANILDLLVWGGVAFAVQVAAFALGYLLVRDVASKMKQGELHPAIVLAGISIAVGILNATALVPPTAP